MSGIPKTRVQPAATVSLAPLGRRAWLIATRPGSLALVDQGVVSGTSLLTTVLVGRFAGLEDLGLYALGFTLLVLLAGVQESLILVPYTVLGHRRGGPERARYAGSTLIQYGLLAGLAALGLVAAGFFTAGTPRLAGVLGVLGAMIPFFLLREFGRRFTFAHLNVPAVLALDLSAAVLQLAGLAWLGASGRLSAASAHAAGGLACAVAGGAWLVGARRHFAVTWNAIGPDLHRSWSFGKWVFGGQLTAVVNGYLAHWLLLPILGAAATGALAACTTVVSLSNPLLIGIGNVLGPRTARAAAEGGGAEVRRVVRTTTLLLGGLMTVFVALVWLFGGWLLEWLYGRAYAGYELTAVALAAATLAGAIGMSADHGLRALGRPETAFKASVLALVVTLAVVLALVGPWKVLGAAGGMLVGSVAGAAVRWVAFRRLTAAAGEGDDAR